MHQKVSTILTGGFFIWSLIISIFLLFILPPKSVHAHNLKYSSHFSDVLPAHPIHLIPMQPDPASEPEPDTYYEAFRNQSWKIPDEVIKTNLFWIEVDLTQQMLYAYRGGQLIDGFLISSGTRSFKTITGIYKIYAKYPSIDMRGPGYDLADVPYSMFFHRGYAIHGTYWHNNFGRPMSKGCVNMLTDEASWIYENASVGTYVIVHY